MPPNITVKIAQNKRQESHPIIFFMACADHSAQLLRKIQTIEVGNQAKDQAYFFINIQL